MSVIQPMEWDSRQLGLPVGRLRDYPPDLTDREFGTYALVLARVPQERREIVARLETFGFRYIGLDLRLAADPRESMGADDTRWRVRRVSRCEPDFHIRGFHIEESRLMLDPTCRHRLSKDFWDRLIYEHCASFADTVICAIDADNRLAGFVSCLTAPARLNLFMVAVHPAQQGVGLGGVLLDHAAALARDRGVGVATNVMASNVRGFNFYARHHFQVEGGDVVMHRWHEDLGRVH
ncbi:MAG: GNAT family N-acetyltransferase [Nitrospirota bacterium]